jgi:gamma-glutamylaminecyclotransferase
MIGAAKTLECFPLVVGQSGVPYLLGDLPGKGKCVVGEIWKVNDETLLGLDEYEGVSKGYYCRKTIKVSLLNGKRVVGGYFDVFQRVFKGDGS